MRAPDKLFLAKASRVLRRKAESLVGRLFPLDATLDAMALRPYELRLELTNLCNANCVFCPYQGRERARINQARGRGEIVRREKPKGAFSGG